MSQRTIKPIKRKAEDTRVKVTHHKAVPGIASEGQINPKTGRYWSLSDPEVSHRVQSMAEFNDPVRAEQFLKQAGFLSAKTGKLKKRYGG